MMHAEVFQSSNSDDWFWRLRMFRKTVESHDLYSSKRKCSEAVISMLTEVFNAAGAPGVLTFVKSEGRDKEQRQKVTITWHYSHPKEAEMPKYIIRTAGKYFKGYTETGPVLVDSQEEAYRFPSAENASWLPAGDARLNPHEILEVNEANLHG